MFNLSKNIFKFNVFICIAVATIIFYSIVFLGLIPCPLCLIQQACLAGILVLSIVGLFAKNHNSIGRLLICIIIILSIIALFFAGKQIYLQYFTPPATPTPIASCSDNSFVLNITKSVTGTIESCSAKEETISGLSLACYSFILFCVIISLNTLSLLTRVFKNIRA